MGRYREVEIQFPEDPSIVCPQCGATSGFKPVKIEEGNSGCAMFFFGGLLPYLLYRSASQNKVYCPNCHYVFTPKVPPNRSDVVIAIAIWVIIVVVCATLVVTTWR